jgi:hypothetical protein
VVRWIHLSIGFQKQLLAEIDIDIEIENDIIEVETLNTKTDLTVEDMNIEITTNISTEEPIENEVLGSKTTLTRTRDEEILVRLTAYVSCLIKGARLVK